MADLSRVAILYAAIIYLARLGENLRASRQRAEQEAAAARAAVEALRRQAELIDPVRADLIAQEMQRVVRERGAPRRAAARAGGRHAAARAGRGGRGRGRRGAAGVDRLDLRPGRAQERPAGAGHDEGQHGALFPAGGRRRWLLRERRARAVGLAPAVVSRAWPG